MPDPIVCTPKSLPRELWVSAAKVAVEHNPVNHPALASLAQAMPGFTLTRERIAVVTTKYWRTNGVRLTVGFLDNPPADLRARILAHMNAWSSRINATFVESNAEPRVRIARTAGSGYWSYLGTDILSINSGEPTMNLEGFTMSTSESEFKRVVRHETGHTLGCPHEHMRREFVARLDETKTIEYFQATQGWSEEEVRQQVLTPVEESSLLGTEHADAFSIMCYQIPGTITKDGKPIVGGLDIDESDYTFLGKIYPKVAHAMDAPLDRGELSKDFGSLRKRLLKAENEREVLRKALSILARGDDDAQAPSFANDVAPLFSRSQISCMANQNVYLDDFAYMSDATGDATYADHANARHNYGRLAGTEGRRMPPGGPFWTPAMLAVFAAWMEGGFNP